MEASKSIRNPSSITHPDTSVSTLGEGGKDYWTRRAHGGDLRAWIKLACCYEMAGETAEGLVVINNFLSMPDLPVELRSEGLLRKAVLQTDASDYRRAWETISQASLEVSEQLKGKLHNQRGRILGCLQRFDEAILEHTAASVYFESIGSSDLLAHTSNNLAGIYRRLNHFEDAHLWVDKAIRVWGDYEYLPHALDHKALIYLDEKKYKQAMQFALRAVASAGDHHKWAVEFRITLARAQAGNKEFSAALETFRAAIDGAVYLNDENLRLKVFIARKAVYELIYHDSVEAAFRLAMKLSAGSARRAAKLLGVNHSVVTNQIKKHPELKVAKPN